MVTGYFTDCVSSLFLSAVGIWLIVRVIYKDTQFLNGLLKVSLWLLVASGMQSCLLLSSKNDFS
jgi:hypothetical protein